MEEAIRPKEKVTAHSPSCHLGVLQMLVVLAGLDDKNFETRVALRKSPGYDTPGRATSIRPQIGKQRVV